MMKVEILSLCWSGNKVVLQNAAWIQQIFTYMLFSFKKNRKEKWKCNLLADVVSCLINTILHIFRRYTYELYDIKSQIIKWHLSSTRKTVKYTHFFYMRVGTVTYIQIRYVKLIKITGTKYQLVLNLFI